MANSTKTARAKKGGPKRELKSRSTKKPSKKTTQKPKSPKPEIRELDVKNAFEQGVLINFRKGGWGARAKVDVEKLGGEIPEDIIRATQDLLLEEDKELLREIRRTMNLGKRWVIKNSMPFPIESFRFIPKGKVAEAEEYLKDISQKTSQLVGVLVEKLDKAKANFKKKYPKHYRPERYPSSDQLKYIFYIKWSFRQFAPDLTMKEFAPEVYEQEMQRFREEINDMKQMTASAIGNAIIGRIDRLRRQCTDDKINARTINGINKFLDQFENEWDGYIAHQELKKIFADIKKYVAKNSSDILKDNEKVREEVGKKMEKIVGDLEKIPNVKLKRKMIF